MTELTQAAALGDDKAWEAIVARYNGLVWHVARGHGLDRDLIADVVQTTWLRLVQHLGRIRDPEATGAWIITVARRESLRAMWRSARERPTDDLDAAAEPNASPEERALAGEVAHVLWRCVGELSPPCQALMRMLMDDPPRPYKEISAALRMPIGSIGPTRARCLDRLRPAIEAAGVSAR
ncbi:MAG: RNA polymerase sigma factor [Egibacteraceae bacterium]